MKTIDDNKKDEMEEDASLIEIKERLTKRLNELKNGAKPIKNEDLMAKIVELEEIIKERDYKHRLTLFNISLTFH